MIYAGRIHYDDGIISGSGDPGWMYEWQPGTWLPFEEHLPVVGMGNDRAGNPVPGWDRDESSVVAWFASRNYRVEVAT